LEFRGVLGVVGKALASQILIEFYFTIFRAKVLKILIFLSGFYLVEIQTNCKNWVLEGKIS
jgi:hypothetical protein